MENNLNKRKHDDVVVSTTEKMQNKNGDSSKKTKLGPNDEKVATKDIGRVINNHIRERGDNDNEDLANVDKTIEKNEKELLYVMDKYATEIVLNEDDDNDDNTIMELKRYKNINHNLYIPIEYKLIDVPTNKFNAYRNLTRSFGYEYNEKNDFLCNGGIMKILELEMPFFCYWKHGLSLYFPKMDIPMERSQYLRFLMKRSSCVEHEFECPVAFKDRTIKCRFVSECELSASFTYLFAGNLRSRKVSNNYSSFQAYHVELDNSKRIETSKFNISDQLTIKNAPMNVYVINKCKHDKCGVGDTTIPFPGMCKIYSKCSEIDCYSELKPKFNMKRCFVYGKGLQGNYHEASNTIYLSTWNMSDIYIINY